ncbi:hypothetical protein OKJ48_01125 [Streptomyces kunmingensis]|uniref:Excreted virulence factor EspC, type VII ESX diderm n=1 Tax=Streptomyces kunmingensis TaxID=68225 RepID=A0ABU6C2E6_9ACTN|nr:hypothetical protein [Streptomyces kunmingensis]MEB3958867.1 hypothetical protein [Streptomyces kunmingensis]
MVSDVGMQLNQVPAEPGGSGGNGGPQGPYLASTPEEKKKAARSIEQTIEPGTRKAGDLADDATGAAVKEFGPKDDGGWVTSGALKTAHSTWGDQIQALLTRLGGEKESLRATNTLLSGTDFQVGGNAGRVPSTFDGY